MRHLALYKSRRCGFPGTERERESGESEVPLFASRTAPGISLPYSVSCPLKEPLSPTVTTGQRGRTVFNINNSSIMFPFLKKTQEKKKKKEQISVYLFYVLWVFGLCVCLCTVCLMLSDVRRGHWIAWNWSDGWL